MDFRASFIKPLNYPFIETIITLKKSRIRFLLPKPIFFKSLKPEQCKYGRFRNSAISEMCGQAGLVLS